MLVLVLFSVLSHAQNNFPYRIELSPLLINQLPGLHSYAYGTHQGKWLIVGGRRDGIHARQPFNAFPSSHNNTSLYVIDPVQQQFWSTTISGLATPLAEQLQSSNINFYQHGDTLVLVGGYAFSASSNDHKTFDGLITIVVSSTIQAIINSQPVSGFIKRIADPQFAVTGAQMGYLNGEFILVGGHRFDGRYNPMGNPTYTQTYTNQIRKFLVNNSGALPQVSFLSPLTNALHLHRRDYNLLPQIFPGGAFGYTISSGVFQTSVNLPFLYPVDINTSGITPVTSFSQYLSNYHSAKAFVYDSVADIMHSLFFGGMSQYSMSNGQLVQDNNVPFVKTISRLSRNGLGVLQEFQHTEEMPGLKGSSAEFIPNPALPYKAHDIVHLSRISTDTLLLGHIYGGIQSPSANPFTNNITSTTTADTTVYQVWLIKTNLQSYTPVEAQETFSFEIHPNPASSQATISMYLKTPSTLSYLLSDLQGNLLKEELLGKSLIGKFTHTLVFDEDWAQGTMLLTLVLNHKHFKTEKLVLNR